MMNKLPFEFLVDKQNNTLTVRRTFAASRQLVWNCHTQPELLEQWFAPQPWQARTKHMDFRVGGYWLYAMCGPAGEEHFGRMDYAAIHPIESFSAWDGFCDAEGNLNPQLPRAQWTSTFSETAGHTTVQTLVTYNSLADLEVVIQMGVKEGLTMALDQLETLLQDLK